MASKLRSEGMEPEAQKLQISVGGFNVSGLLSVPRKARALFVLAHGAGAGMNHSFMASVADALAEQGIGSLRYNFPYMEKGSKRPDAPPLAHAAVRAAVQKAAELANGGLPLFAGGKSFGGRMTSQAQAAEPLPSVLGLIFLGFPLHPAGKPSVERAKHLRDVRLPMLFLQGTRDQLAERALLEPLCGSFGSQVTLKLWENADHSFHVPARSEKSDQQILQELVETIASWIDEVLAVRRGT
jgi:hypothetical protein